MNSTLHILLSSFPYAVAAGLIISIVCALLGVFVILKRVVFIGVTLSEMAACGMALAIVVGLTPCVGAVCFTLAGVAALAIPFEKYRIPRDAFLGVLFVAASSTSVLLVANSGHGLQEIKSLLYGDLILTSPCDLKAICWTMLPSLLCIILFIRPMLYSFLDREASTVLRVHPSRWELLFFLALGIVVAVASKVAGAILVFCYLILPATFALALSRRFWAVLAISAVMAASSTLAGFCISLNVDLPTNQIICTTMCGLLAVSLIASAAFKLILHAKSQLTNLFNKVIHQQKEKEG